MKTKNIFTATATVLLTLFCLVANGRDHSSAAVAVVPVAGVITAGKKTVPSSLNHATVFFNGAELTHTSSAELVKGPNEITVEGLSPYADLNSLKIKVSGAAMVTSYEFTHDYLSSAKKENPNAGRLRESIEEKNALIAQINVDKAINANMLEYLRAGTSKNVSGSEAGLGIDELKKTMDYYMAKASELEAAKMELLKKEQKLREEISALQAQLNQDATKNNKTSGILKLNISSNATVKSDIQISYFTSAAAWLPYYDINVKSAGEPVSIAAKSKVYQTTGIDWEKVKLTLSTAVPNNGKVSPVLGTWFLQPLYEARDRSRMSKSLQAMKPMAMEISADYSMDEEIHMMKESKAYEAQPTIMDYINVSENQLNITYEIDIPYSVPGNGKPQNIDLTVKEAEAEYRYNTVPKLDQRAYLVAEIGDWQKLGLLSGSANVTFEGTYVGETYIDSSSTEEKLLLTLGTDSRVAVKREKTEDFSSKRVLGSDIEQIYTYRITVKNNQNSPVNIDIKDQYPISTQKEIVVSLRTKETTDWSENDTNSGIITWKAELQPGESRTYDISYSVKRPKSMRLNL